MASDRDWASAYALQALSDLHAREVLLDGAADRCHTLHFLQMAAEKVCKAYLVDQNGEHEVRRVHNYVQSVLPVIARWLPTITGEASLQRWKLESVKHVAREIELLAPACHEEHARPDNSEYPWLDGKQVVRVPCRYGFPGIDEADRIFVTVIRLLRAAAKQYV